ncbi:Gonadotropin subunit beta-1 [Liparis tanakae]|uniref:Gonadotropin subunit beta-1 n=1 Tax=Liparis tanakae TaxID=230148 RepID=A0A4Z2FTF7_9TELE|nr:Gonadotropin subunit beta-1 [Liparis tanakae]
MWREGQKTPDEAPSNTGALQDLVYVSDTQTYEQETCMGVWAYEVKHIDGCPEGVTYPVAKNCNCDVCDPNKNTDCNRFTGKASSCLSI